MILTFLACVFQYDHFFDFENFFSSKLNKEVLQIFQYKKIKNTLDEEVDVQLILSETEMSPKHMSRVHLQFLKS